MARSLVILVKPQHWDEDDEEWVGATTDEAENQRRWAEYKRLDELFRGLGFIKHDHRSSGGMAFNCDGCNWEGKMTGDLYDIPADAIALMEGRAKEMAKVKEAALAKLSPEEQYALGLLKQP